MNKLPISREDSDKVAQAFIEGWNPAILAERGLHQAIRDIIYDLQDRGFILCLTVDEGHQLSEWLCDNGIGMEVFNAECALVPELKSAVQKLLFANGRCFGLMNIDMGIEEEDDGRQAGHS